MFWRSPQKGIHVYGSLFEKAAHLAAELGVSTSCEITSSLASTSDEDNDHFEEPLPEVVEEPVSRKKQKPDPGKTGLFQFGFNVTKANERPSRTALQRQRKLQPTSAHFVLKL
mmetsp:Transcript_9172/g.12015  ORF Transcript_9172/g.12015 Transcript_9172/m.12015 type:complete len:113 (+) Transcript_9172:119-457(+)